MAGDPHPRVSPNDAPILEFDPTREAIVEAAQVPYIKKGTGRQGEMPERVVLCFFQEVIARMVAEYGARRLMTLRSEIGPKLP
jgi:hypothetical protein